MAQPVLQEEHELLADDFTAALHMYVGADPLLLALVAAVDGDHVARLDDDEWDTRADRLLRIVLDGLRANE